jgi:small-conductance mechanosensitive channel
MLHRGTGVPRGRSGAMLDIKSLTAHYGADAAIWIRYGVIAVLAVMGALLLHAAIDFVLRRMAARTASLADDLILARIRRPTRALFALIAIAGAQPAMQLGPIGRDWWSFGAGLVVPAMVGWLVAALLGAMNDIVQLRADITVADNLRARRKRTRAGILYRISLFLVLLVTICLMLMSIPAVRTVGVTLAASAGIGALAVGAAAQPALKNIIAGIQMAFTEPIRLDDVVIVEGEWGRIEEIRLTYVVVAIWDQRRLVVPVSKFLEDSFQNWTRSTSDLLGTAFLHVDRTADVPRLRAKLTEIVAADPLWDGRVCGLQVTDSTAGWLELRCLMSSADAARSFDLRCNVREAMTAFIAHEMPEALPRAREEVALQPIAAASSTA